MTYKSHHDNIVMRHMGKSSLTRHFNAENLEKVRKKEEQRNAIVNTRLCTVTIRPSHSLSFLMCNEDVVPLPWLLNFGASIVYVFQT